MVPGQAGGHEAKEKWVSCLEVKRLTGKVGENEV